MKSPATAVLALGLTAALSARVLATGSIVHRLDAAPGDVVFEVAGQVSNPTPGTSNQYGYVTFVRGLSAADIFTTAEPTLQNETTARLTFFTEAITERVITNGRLRIINRTGTTTIYRDEVPDGTFADPASFRDGVPVARMDYRQQVVLDAADGTFTVVNLLAVEAARTFEIGGERVRLARRGDRFRQFYSGAPPVGTPALNGVFAGYAVAIASGGTAR
jgi:hypothetical protein